jgi:hypothetical protein
MPRIAIGRMFWQSYDAGVPIRERTPMQTAANIILFFLTLLAAGGAVAESFPKVDADLAEYDAAIETMKAAFAGIPEDAASKDWIAKKLQHMVDIDQHMRKFGMSIPHERQYTEAEKKYFWSQFMNRFLDLDRQNTAELKSLLSTHSWFTISKFGKKCDHNAWLLVQHADQDPEFQKEVLAKLERLYPTGETKAQNYAYLFDRVALASNDPSKRQPQRYGTQGHCLAPGKWQPFPIEDEPNIDTRRAEVGLPPLAEYIAGFQDICK